MTAQELERTIAKAFVVLIALIAVGLAIYFVVHDSQGTQDRAHSELQQLQEP